MVDAKHHTYHLLTYGYLAIRFTSKHYVTLDETGRK